MSEPKVKLLTREEVLAHLEKGGAVEEPRNSTGALAASGTVGVYVRCSSDCCGADFDSFEEFWESYGKHEWQVADWWDL